MAHLALSLLGPFQAMLDGEPAEGLNSDYLRALLAYVAVEGGREHAREALASLLWPERPDGKALDALRYALSNLRGPLGDRRSSGDHQAPAPFLHVTRASVQFNPASDHWLDVAEFADLAGVGREDPASADLSGLTKAVQLYRGPFLHGLSVGDSPAFDEWVLLKGEEYQRSVLSVLGRLAYLQAARGEYAEAARWARRQLELEPYREQAHRQLMAALALGGERSAALAHYAACRRLLAEDLGCEPEDETQALYAQIRDGGLSQSRTQPQRFPIIVPTLPPAAAGRPPHCFVARDQELARLDSHLQRALAGRGGVALIAGEAGSGKTALLDEFARRAIHAHGDLIALRGSCNAHGGAGDPYLPFREMLQTLAGDVEGKRAGGTFSPEQARRAWEALPTAGAAFAEHGPDLIDRFVSGEALLRHAEGFPAPPGASRWQAKLREIVRRSREVTATVPGADLGAPAPHADLLAQVTRVLHTVAVERPLLLMIDDLQWADGGTVALLFHLGRRLADSRMLLVCAYRPEALKDPMEPKGRERPLGSVLRELRREWGDVLVDLDRTDGRAFVEAYVDSEPNRLGTAFRQALYDHTGGNALFTVEVLRSFRRDGTLAQDEAGRWVLAAAAGPDWDRWPPRVEAVIAGHLADLSDEERMLLQAASVQGEQFLAEVVARVLDWRAEKVIRLLSDPLQTRHRRVQAVSLDRLAWSEQRLSRYRFCHALVQRSVYRSLDAVKRAQLHEATGRSLEAVYAPRGPGLGHPGAQVQALAPELARHYEAAGLPMDAARQRLASGHWAARLVAYEEAIAHLERGLALLDGVAASPERLCLELSLCSSLAIPAMLRRGGQAPVHARALERLSDLVQHPDLQDEPRRLTALTVLAYSTVWSAGPERAQRVGEQLLELAQDDDRQSVMLGYWVLGLSHWLQGHLVAARAYLDQVLNLYDSEDGRPLSPLLAGDPGVMARAMLGLVLWMLGYPDQGRANLRQALAHAQETEQPSSQAFAHFTAVMASSIFGRDVASAIRHTEALRRLDHASLPYAAWIELLAGQALIHGRRTGDGAPDPGLKQVLTRVAEATSTWQSTGSGASMAGLLLLQAQMCAWTGHAEMGLATMDRAQAWVEHTGMRATLAEIWRMRGELLLLALTADPAPARGSGENAEWCFHHAVEIAREQESRWLELRATVSLARLWGSHGRRDEARELLSGVYGWFTEGFDMVDLVEAKALLEELS